MSDGDDRHADVNASASRGGDPAEDLPFGDATEPRGPVDPRDERVTDDAFSPPKIPCECYCLHCQRTFMSTGIWFQRVKNARPGQFDGFWMCPTPNCDGKGFTFDIFPTDPDHPANEGWHYDDDEDEDDAWDEEEEWDGADEASPATAAEADYDPDEAKWKRLDDELGEEADDDLEGEEWKFGLQPGERPEPEWQAAGRRQREEEERRYDMPDERPKEIEWEEPPPSSINEDDIPF